MVVYSRYETCQFRDVLTWSKDENEWVSVQSLTVDDRTQIEYERCELAFAQDPVTEDVYFVMQGSELKISKVLRAYTVFIKPTNTGKM